MVERIEKREGKPILELIMSHIQATEAMEKSMQNTRPRLTTPNVLTFPRQKGRCNCGAILRKVPIMGQHYMLCSKSRKSSKNCTM